MIMEQHGARKLGWHVAPSCRLDAAAPCPGSLMFLPPRSPGPFRTKRAAAEAGMAWPETHDNLTTMESWRRADVPVLPGSGPAPRLHDTATGELVLAAAGPVATLYACGITPYDATHMGHAATYTAWDLLVRAWLDAAAETPETRQAPGGPARYTVVYVQNVTDVDDPLLERAERDGEDWRELARRETQRYREDMEALRVLPPNHLIGAVEALPVIERCTGRIADRGGLPHVDA